MKSIATTFKPPGSGTTQMTQKTPQAQFKNILTLQVERVPLVFRLQKNLIKGNLLPMNILHL